MRPRVLMLHGMLRNAKILEAKLRSVAELVEAEFVFVNAPHVMMNPTVRRSLFELATNYRAGETSKADVAIPAEDHPRCWWFAEDQDKQSGHFCGVSESLAFLRQVMIEQGPFDGIVGFSMGASIATLLCSLIEDPSRHPVFAQAGPSWPPPSQLKFAVMASGFLCQDQDEVVQAALAHKLQTPTLLIFGATDTIVPDYGFFDLSDTYAHKRVEWHEGGHHFPIKPKWIRFVSEYINASLYDPSSRDSIIGPGGGTYGRSRDPPAQVELTEDEVAIVEERLTPVPVPEEPESHPEQVRLSIELMFESKEDAQSLRSVWSLPPLSTTAYSPPLIKSKQRSGLTRLLSVLGKGRNKKKEDAPARMEVNRLSSVRR